MEKETRYPNDADGDALRRVVEGGADMTRPMLIDFSIDAPNESVAKIVADLSESRGYKSSIFYDDESKSWSVYCARSMLATYDGVVTAQEDLNDLVREHGAECDGWGTFGNMQGR